jgi:hypothetical protein
VSEMLRGSFRHFASVPDPQLPFTRELWRWGHGLVLFGTDGHHRINSHFSGESRPPLIAPNEMRLLSYLVDLSSGSVTAEL